MSLTFPRVAIAYGIGSLGGAVTVFVDWAVREFAGGGLALLTFKPGLETFYQPTFWGGLWGLLFLLPVGMSWMGRGLIFGIFPALTHLALESGGFHKVVELIAPERLLRHDMLLVLLVYMLAWGLLCSYLNRTQNGGGD